MSSITCAQCGKRPAQCSDCGRTDELWFEELEQHKAEDCPKRTVTIQIGDKWVRISRIRGDECVLNMAESIM